MEDAEATVTPAISARIRRTREDLQEQWDADHPGENGNPYTQEKVASRVGPSGVTVGAYRKFETVREPKLSRLRQIAVALELDEDYFLPTGNLASATARLEAEADRFAGLGVRLEGVVGALEALLPDPPPERTPDAPDGGQPQPEQDPPQR